MIIRNSYLFISSKYFDLEGIEKVKWEAELFIWLFLPNLTEKPTD